MTDSSKCPNCGARLPEEGAECLACLMAGGIEEAKTVPTIHGSDDLAGREIGEYQILKIAEGGTAEVYRARQLQPVDREVAFKLIKPGMDSERVSARFDAERQLLARLQHPNIATILDAGRTDGGRPFFVMEFVDGVPITEFASRRKLEVRERLELFATVCKAVQHAHQRGIIHRDLKPSNILVDESAQPKVIDFGIARAMEGELQEHTLFLTREGDFLGTPAYMSPEQARGEIGEIDTRTDVYSLGVVLYELLTGHLPFDRDKLSSAGFAELQRMVNETDVQRPSLRRTTTAVSAGAIRGDLDWIVMKALEKSKERRYDGAAAFGDDITRHLAYEPVSAGPPTVGYRLKKFVRRHRSLAVGSMVAIVALVAGAGISIWQAIEAMEARNLADRSAAAASAAEHTARREADISKAINGFLVADLLGAVDFDDDPDPDVRLLELVDRAAAKTDQRFADRPQVALAVHRLIGDIYLALGRYDEAWREYDRFRQINAGVPAAPGYARNSMKILRQLSITRLRQRRLGESRDLLELHIEAAAAAGIPEETLLSARMQMATQVSEEGFRGEAVQMLEELIPTLVRVKGPQDFFTLQAKYNLGLNFTNIGRAREAVPLMKEFLDSLGDVKSQNRTSAMTELARTYMIAGRTDDAEKMLVEALALQDEILADDSPQRINTLASLASLYDRQERTAEAIEMYEKAIADGLREDSQAREQAAVALHNLALVKSSTDLVAAEKLMRRAIEERTAHQGPNNPSTLNSHFNLGLIENAQGRWQDAERSWTTSREGYRRLFGDRHPQVHWNNRLIADSCFATNRRDEGIAICRTILTTELPEPGADRKLALTQRRKTASLLTTHVDDPGVLAEIFLAALETDTEDEGLWMALGRALAARAAAGAAAEGVLDDLRAATCCVLAGSAGSTPSDVGILIEWLRSDPLAKGLNGPRPVLDERTEWRYQAVTPAVDDWRSPAFEDSKWPGGRGEFGYGDGDEVTVLDFGEDPANKPMSACFRVRFEFDAERDGPLGLSLICDDGAVVFVDGVEFARVRMPDGPVAPDTPALRAGALESVPATLEVPPAQFAEGTSHLIAVQVHQDRPSSSDLSFRLTASTGELSLVEVLERIPPASLDAVFGEESEALGLLRKR